RPPRRIPRRPAPQRTDCAWGGQLPADRLPLVLLVEPFLERSKIIANGSGVHLPLAGDSLEGIGPRAAPSHLEHRVQALAGFLISVNGATMQRPFAPRRPGKGAMKLELQNVGEKVAHVGNVSGHVILGAEVEILLAAVCG